TDLPEKIAARFQGLHGLLENKYGFDVLYERILASAGRETGDALWQVGDVRLIDGLMVNGSAKAVGWFSGVLRHVQTGYLFHYAFVMIAGLLAMMLLFVTFRVWGG
ncbi:MAG: NADH-quinone oxidoreductase subunit L, partial [Gammaproteobacteria bacterium]